METTIIHVEFVPLIIPTINGRFPPPPADSFESFPSYCGAGEGIGDLIVPETIIGLNVSPACWIHDYSWNIAEDTPEHFFETNGYFLLNMLSIINRRSSSTLMQIMRGYRAMTYYNAVSTAGIKIFEDLKRGQGWPGNMSIN